MTQYPDEFSPSDRGRTRQAVVDLLTEGGGRRRLSNPDQRLDDAGVRSGDTLDVNPEVVAGAIDPRLHEQGLARARAQIVAFKEGAGRKFNFSVRANTALPPTEYLLNFEAPSFAPPPAQGGSPERIGRHEVFLLLPADFPMKAPLAIWQTPIWHPNIALKTGDVCLGALAESYRPDFDFGVLCQMLIDIASYQSYAWVQKVLNAEASVWAFGEGQAQIQQIGGRRERKREDSDTDEIDAGLTIREL